MLFGFWNFSYETGDPAEAYGVKTVRRLTNTASQSSFEVAAEWIRHCQIHHNCSGNLAFMSPGAPGPRRLVDVHAFGASSLDSRLVEISASGPCPKYVTLSYCWGETQNVEHLTTRESLESRRQRISHDSLPRTLQDS